MKRGWLVITETGSLLGLQMGWELHREFRYYRWRWVARASAWLTNVAPVLIGGCYQRSLCVGRVSAKGD